ncbi:unnamed protein product, partial [Cyprideis torosa]
FSLLKAMDKSKEAKLRTAINQRMIESGEKEKLRELLRTRLEEFGWPEQVKQVARDVVKERGAEKITVDDLVTEITPKGRALVPDSLKRELLQRIKKFMDESDT